MKNLKKMNFEENSFFGEFISEKSRYGDSSSFFDKNETSDYINFGFHISGEKNKRLLNSLSKVLPDNFLGLFSWKGIIVAFFDNDGVAEEVTFGGWETPSIIEYLVNRKVQETNNELLEVLLEKEQYEETDEKFIAFKNLNASRIIYRQLRHQILTEQKWKCANCGCTLKMSKYSEWEGVVAHIDHIHPFVDRMECKQFINDRSNLQALCSTCNLKKGKNKN